MEDLSLHLLDIVENSTSAGATLVEITLMENRDRDVLTLTVKDNGRGMDRDFLNKVRDPFTTTRTTRKVGMGISLLEQAAGDAEGKLSIHSEPGKGTEITATFRLSHIDRKPTGNMASTLVTLIIGNPETNFIYHSNADGKEVEINTMEIKKELAGVPITDPAVLELIKNLFNK